MKTVKLTCQGCGADLEPTPGVTYIKCAYCGTSNALSSGAGSGTGGAASAASSHQAGAPKPQSSAPAHVQISLGGVKVSGRSVGTDVGKRVGRIITIVVVAILVGVGVLVWSIMSTVKKETDRGRDGIRRAFDMAFDGLKGLGSKKSKKGKDDEFGVRGLIDSIKKKALGAFGRMGGSPKFRLESDKVFVKDVNGDGEPDVISRAEQFSGGRDKFVAALSGKDLSILWRYVYAKKRSRRAKNLRLFFPGGTLLFVRDNLVQARSLKDGSKIWGRELTDTVVNVVAAGGHLVAETSDGKRVALDKATGKINQGMKPAPIKFVARDDSRKYAGRMSGATKLKGKHRRELSLRFFYCADGKLLRGTSQVRRSGFFRSRTTTYGCAGEYIAALAKPRRGTNVPVIVGFHRARGMLWAQSLSARRVTARGTPAMALAGDKLVVGYNLYKVGPSLRMFDLKTGQTVWHNRMDTAKDHAFLKGVVLQDGRVYARVTNGLWILDAKTGKTLVTL